MLSALQSEAVKRQVVRTQSEIKEMAQILSDSEAVGCDTETSSLHAKFGKLHSIQFSSADVSILVPISEGVEIGALKAVLANPSVTKIFHNARFDLPFLNTIGCEVENVFDTMIAEKVLTRGANQSSSLADTLYRYFAVDLDKEQRKSFNSSWDGVWTDALVDYALSDVEHLSNLMREQQRWLRELALESEYAAQFERQIRTPSRHHL